MSEEVMQKNERVPILEVKGMTKNFGSVTALKNVDLTLMSGDVLGLIGENGSGKSTISSIVAGMQKATSCDSMKYKGKDWAPTSMVDALNNCGTGSHGIGMIVQESGVIPGITVAENIFLGEIDKFRYFPCGPINRKKMYKEAREALDAIGITDISEKAIMSTLSFQSKKLVEIAKVIRKDPDILIVDETSTALAHDGRKILYNIVNKFRGTEKSVIFISHDLDEIMEVCDTLTVLRDGNIIRTFKKEEYEPSQIRKAMIGRELSGDYYRSDTTATNNGIKVLELKDVSIPNQLENINLTLYGGEILGLGGLSGCGMHQVGKVAFGVMKPTTGSVKVFAKDKEKPVTSAKNAMDLSIGYVSKDRDIESLNLSASIKDNIAIGGLDKFSIKNFLILMSRERKYVKKQVDDFSIKCLDAEQLVSHLSGGNKQKVVFGKWIGRNADILVLDCPTRGIDIGVKQSMYQLMTKLKNEGKSILLISEELPELLGMSDRVLIMKDGKIMKEFARSATLSDADVIDYMI